MISNIYQAKTCLFSLRIAISSKNWIIGFLDFDFDLAISDLFKPLAFFRGGDGGLKYSSEEQSTSVKEEMGLY